MTIRHVFKASNLYNKNAYNLKILIKIIFLNFRHPKIIGFLSWMLDVDFGFFGCLSLSFEFGLPHPHPHPKLNFFWVPVSVYHVF